MSDTALATPEVAASATIRTTGILHFTIGVRDHVAASKFYSEVLGCRIMRINPRYAFMECGGSYFVLAKMPNHVSPNLPGEDSHHHAFMVEPEEFDRALAIMKARGIEMIKYSDQGHVTFPGRHAYFQRVGDGIALSPREWSGLEWAMQGKSACAIGAPPEYLAPHGVVSSRQLQNKVGHPAASARPSRNWRPLNRQASRSSLPTLCNWPWLRLRSNANHAIACRTTEPYSVTINQPRSARMRH